MLHALCIHCIGLQKTALVYVHTRHACITCMYITVACSIDDTIHHSSHTSHIQVIDKKAAVLQYAVTVPTAIKHIVYDLNGPRQLASWFWRVAVMTRISCVQ